MVPARYDVTELVRARRRTRPPTWLFLLGLGVGWVLDALLVALLVTSGQGAWVAVGAAVLGYLLLPVPVVTGLREWWLRSHRDRAGELDRLLGEHVPALCGWVDERVGEPADLPPDLAVVWLLRPEPASAQELLPLPPAAGWRVGGTALAARHEQVDARTVVRLAVLPNATIIADGPELPA